MIAFLRTNYEAQLKLLIFDSENEFFLMLMVIITHRIVNSVCHKAPSFVLGQALHRCRQHFISEHVIGQVSQSDFGPGPNDADAAKDQIPGHHGLNTKNMFNSTSCFRSRMVAALFSLCQFFMAVFVCLNSWSSGCAFVVHKCYETSSWFTYLFDFQNYVLRRPCRCQLTLTNIWRCII